MATNLARTVTKRPLVKKPNRTGAREPMSFRGVDREGEILGFDFFINPSQLKRSRRKLGQWVLTKFGYERQNWGNDLFTFDYSGITGVFRPDDNDEGPSFDLRDTIAFQNFAAFEFFYEETGNRQNLVRMSYWGFTGEFVGELEDFTYTHDVYKDTHAFRYQFKFTGIPTRGATLEVVTHADETDVGALGDFTTPTESDTIVA